VQSYEALQYLKLMYTVRSCRPLAWILEIISLVVELAESSSISYITRGRYRHIKRAS